MLAVRSTVTTPCKKAVTKKALGGAERRRGLGVKVSERERSKWPGPQEGYVRPRGGARCQEKCTLKVEP
jgi:hypothetical protein